MKNFLSGWLAFAYAILFLCIPFWYAVIEHPDLDYSRWNWLWLIGAAVYVTGVRVVQVRRAG